MMFGRNKLEFNAYTLVFLFILTSISVHIFSAIIESQNPDIYAHNVMALRKWGLEVLSHPFYFALLKLFSGFTSNIEVVNTVSIILLSAAIVARFLMINFLLRKLISDLDYKYQPWILSAISFSLCIVHAIPYRKATLMVGLFTPTVWHNSTVIVLVPIALLAFWYSYQVLILPSTKSLIILSGLLVISILIKPNFFLCFAPAFLLLLIRQYYVSFGRKFLYSLLPVIAGSIILAGEYWIIVSSERGEGVKIGLFLVWNHFANVKWLSFLFSFAFPLSYAVFNFRLIRNDRLLLYSWLIVFWGLVVYSIFYESGPRMFHANFIWQMVPALLILYLCTITNLLNLIKNNFKLLLSTKYLIILGIFMLHLMAGCVYIYKVINIDIW